MDELDGFDNVINLDDEFEKFDNNLAKPPRDLSEDFKKVFGDHWADLLS